MIMSVIVMLTATAAGFIQAVSGFGGALIMMMTLPFFFSMGISTALAGLICVPMCITIAWKYRKKIRLELVLVPAVIYLVVSGICIKVAAAINLDSLKAVFGILLIGLAVYFNFFSSNLHIRADFKTALICAGISGITGGLFGIGGPLLVLYYLATTDDKESYLGTINLVFSITEGYSAIMRYCSGLISMDQGSLILLGFVTILIGRYLGSRVVDRLDGEKMKKCIYLLLALSGLVTFLRAMGWF